MSGEDEFEGRLATLSHDVLKTTEAVLEYQEKVHKHLGRLHGFMFFVQNYAKTKPRLGVEYHQKFEPQFEDVEGSIHILNDLINR